jgi:superfamily II DNA helicase RecQ
MKILDCQNISAELVNILKEATDNIILISPYLDLNEQIRLRLKEITEKNNNPRIRIIYRDMKENNSKIWLKNLENVELFHNKNLHAKCYLNENKAILTSMNLYEYSQQNNLELGILIDNEKEKFEFQNLKKEVDFIINNSTKIKKENLNSNKDILEETKEKNNFEIELEKFSDIEIAKIKIFKNWRNKISKDLKKPAYTILTNNEILELIKQKITKIKDLYSIKGLGTKKINKFGTAILEILDFEKKFSLVKIKEIEINVEEYGYDKVIIETLNDKKVFSLNTINALPKKNSTVAVKINFEKGWFNEWFEV